MLYSQTEPVVESCTNIKFLSMTYGYRELFSQMRPSMVSPWTNNWFDIYDFTPHKRADDGSPNFYCVPQIDRQFMRPLEEAK